MRFRLFFPGALSLSLAGLIACGGGGSSSRVAPVNVTVQGQFEKRTLTPSGFSSTLSTLPTRYCYAEIRDNSSNEVLASGFLDDQGLGTATIPGGNDIFVVIYADYQVPNTPADGSFFMEGSIKSGTPASRYANADAFNALPEWYVTSDTVHADHDGTLSLTALQSTRESGAFNIADQAVHFAISLRDLQPTLRLPDLHCFWDPSSGGASTSYPSVAFDTQGHVLQQQAPAGRAIFHNQVRGLPGAGTGADEYCDGVLQESFAHLLFADYSYPEDGSSSSSILRRDNDSVYVARTYPSESCIAFIDGFCDFLSAAIREDPAITSLDSDGTPSTFDLSRHDQFAPSGGGEFYRGSVGISLYGIWKNALGGDASGLQRLWQTAQRNGSGEYLNAPLGCYPTYLLGLKNTLGGAGATWNTLVLGELAKENIGDVTDASYLGSPAHPGTYPLWILEPASAFLASGTLHTYPPTDGIYYDRDQAQAYRFSLASPGFPTIRMTPTGGQDFWLELIGPTGILSSSQDDQGGPVVRTLTFPSGLPSGDYVVRVRAGYSYSSLENPAAGYDLSVQ